jgi:hypothetical protein
MVCRRLLVSVADPGKLCRRSAHTFPILLFSSTSLTFSHIMGRDRGRLRARRCRPRSPLCSSDPTEIGFGAPDAPRATRRQYGGSARARRQAVRDAVLRGVHAPRQAGAGAPRRAGHRRRPGAPRAQRAREPVRQVRRARSAAAPFSRFLSGIARQSAQRQASGALRTRSVKWCLPTPPSGPFSRRHRHHRGASRTTSLLGGAAETARGAARPRRFARRR